LRSTHLLPVLLVIIALILTGSLASAQYYGGPGGQISGFVYGTNGGGYDWAEITANSNNQTFHAFSGMSGFYLIRVPPGVYKLSISTPGLNLVGNSTTVTVTDNSSLTVNFHLQQPSIIPTPEFPTNLTPLILVLAFAGAIAVLKKSTKRFK